MPESKEALPESLSRRGLLPNTLGKLRLGKKSGLPEHVPESLALKRVTHSSRLSLAAIRYRSAARQRGTRHLNESAK